MSDRAQTSLPPLAVALLVLATVTGLGLAVGDGALTAADRDPADRRVASSLADRLVAPDAPTTYRSNVLNGSVIDELDDETLSTWFPASIDVEDVAVRVNDSTVASTGDASGGVTIRRLVVVERRDDRTLTPALGRTRTLTLPRRAGAATLSLEPPSGAEITTVHADERVVLHDPDGLNGTFDVELSRYETTTLAFEGAGSLPTGSVTIEYAPPRTTRTELVVTADA